jgi:hypothetical protein
MGDGKSDGKPDTDSDSLRRVADIGGRDQPDERAVLGSFCSFGRRMRWVLVGIMFRIISSFPKHSSRSPGSSARFSLGLGMTVVPR